MKSKLVMAAAMAFAGYANAQSAVTLFGVVDSGIARVSSTGGGHSTGMVSGANATGRLGFRGVEDLGGGLAASFWLEGEVVSDTGNPTGFNFTRRSTVSLSSNSLGEIRLGRDFVPTYLVMSAFDTFGQRGYAAIEAYGLSTTAATGGGFTAGGAAFNYVRANNTVTYFAPADLGGFYGSAQYAFGERNSSTATSATDSSKQGNLVAGRLGYQNGPMHVSIAYADFSDVSRAATYVGDYKIASAGGSWDFGVVKANVFAQTERMGGHGALPDYKFNTYVAGAGAPVGAFLLRAAVALYDSKTATASSADATKVSVGVVYNLSKRTALYADIARLNNRNQANFSLGGVSGSLGGAVAPARGGNSTGTTVGLRHFF